MNRVFQNEFDDIVRRTVVPFFKGLGFKRRGNCFNKTTNDIIQVANIQKSQWNHADSVSFTLNIGFFNSGIYRGGWNQETPKVIREYDCQIHFRLGYMTKGMDYWYELNEKRTVAELEKEVEDHLNNYLRPLLEANKTLKSLKELLTMNQDLKLTILTADYVLLLLKTGDKEEAERVLRNEYKESLTPKESISVTNYPDGRREEKISKPSINNAYVDRLRRLAETNEIVL